MSAGERGTGSVGKGAALLLRLLLILLALTPLGIAVYREWPELQNTLQGAHWGSLAAAQLLLMPIMLLVGTIPWASLRQLGSGFSYAKATGIYFFTQTLKYLPGGFWAFPGRMAVYRVLGLERARSIISVFRETTAFFLGAATIGLLGLLRGLPLSDTLRWALAVGTLASAVAIFLTQMPWFWRFLSTFNLFKTSTVSAYAEVEAHEVSLAWLPPAWLGSVSFYLFFGIPFRQMAVALHAGAASLSWLEAASIFALAWCAGFVVVFIPAGIGVRESVLAFLLSNIMPAGAALGLALLARLAWVVAEGFWILVTMVWLGRSSELSWDAMRQRGGEGGDPS